VVDVLHVVEVLEHVENNLDLKRAHAFDLESVALTATLLESQDCVILATDHDAFDYEFIAAHAPLIVDTRGRYLVARANIVKA